MTICDRCESRTQVKEIILDRHFGPEPINREKSKQWVRELCPQCVAYLGRAIDAALEPLPKEAKP